MDEKPTKCTICGYGFTSFGKPMEICYSYSMQKWTCLECFMKWQDETEAKQRERSTADQ